jgi:quercetin dioxygenase-like cupin family protein
MPSRRQFVQHSSAAILAGLLPAQVNAYGDPGFTGILVQDYEGETIQMRDGTAIVKIKIARSQGATSFSFLSESFRPGDKLPVHKHLNEDELIFLFRGLGLFTLGEKQFEVKAGAVALVPKGTWHGLDNIGTEVIEMRFGYTPSGFEGFFREVGTPAGQTFIKRTMAERRAIARKWGMIYKD